MTILEEKTIKDGKRTYQIAKSEINNGYLYWVRYNENRWPKVFHSFGEMTEHYVGLKDLPFF